MKRIYFYQIEQFDLKNDESNIRHLEMLVDNITNFDVGYNIQFWRDMNTYGLREAILYLKNHYKAGDFTKIDQLAAEITKKLENQVVLNDIINQDLEI